MVSKHRAPTTSRIARMLRELEGSDAAENRAVDVGNPATDRDDHPPKYAAQRWFKTAAILIAAGFVGAIVSRAGAIEMTEAAVTASGACFTRPR